MATPDVSRDDLSAARFARALVGVGCISAAILMIELALTRIFSVTMYYHFAFLAISIALFGLSASGVYVYLARRAFATRSASALMTVHALLFAVATILALAALVRIRVGLNYSPSNLAKMIAIYTLAALPFFTGGAVISLAISRFSRRVNVVYGADLIGAAAGCLLLLPLLNRFGAPGVVLLAAVLGGAAALLFAPAAALPRVALAAAITVGIPGGAQLMGTAPFDVSNTKGHDADRVLFAKWNSFSRVAVYDRSHGDWSLSSKYTGPRPETRFMDIDSAASTPIVRFDGDVSKVDYLKYELTGLAFHLVKDNPGFTTLVIGPGGGRDLLTALAFGSGRVDGVEVNPIIARDVMLGQFRDFSGSIYERPGVTVAVDDGRSFIRRSGERYDVIQASLVDTWAATAAGAYTLTENKFGDVDVLINNAGIQRYGSVTETPGTLWDEVMNINLKSMFLCSQAVIPSMRRRGSGVIINVSSVQAFHSQQKVAAYTTSKTAILGLTRSIAVDYAPQIRCIAVCPGTVDTPMLQEAIATAPDPAAVRKECEDMHLLQRIAAPAEIAELIGFLCSDKAGFITGQAIRTDGGLGIMIPGSAKK